jgi:hypothetical protein
MTHSLIKENAEEGEIKAYLGDGSESPLHHRTQAAVFLRPEGTFDWMDHALPFALNDGDLFLS